MKIIQLITAVCFIGALAACSRVSGDEKARVEPAKVISAAPERTSTPARKTPTSTRKPQWTATVEITPTAFTPVPQLTPMPEPLNQNGPWMMLSPDIFYTGQARIVGPVFINSDGTGWEPAKLPHDPHSPPDELDWWFGSVSPKSPYVAFQDYLTEYTPICPNGTPSDYQLKDTLYILKLPENKIVRQVSLFGKEASDQISKEECEYVNQGRYDTPPVLGVVQNFTSFYWSPDGRYLAFPAAFEGPGADLYLYDTQTDKLRRLTTRQNNPDILGWSPDGQTIIYRSITKMDLLKVRFLESSGLFAVSVAGADRMLFEPEVIPNGLSWLSPSQFLISDGFCDIWVSGLCTTHLRLVDLATGTNEVLYSNPQIFIHYETDPIHHLLMIENPPSDMPGLAGMEAKPHEYQTGLSYVSGIFHYDFQTKSLQPVLLENSLDLHWDADLLAFRSDGYTIRYLPGEGFDVEKEENIGEKSPDGQWSINKIGEDWFILDIKNRPVQQLQSSGGSWSPDSSAFIELIPEDMDYLTSPRVIVYLRENNWQPVITRQILYGSLWSGQWITP